MHHRVLAIDVGERRVGLAISDASATLARPLLTLAVRGVADAAEKVGRELAHLASEEDGLSAIVVGRPLRLDGSSSPATSDADAFVAALRNLTKLPISWVDERLTSREAEARLAVRERDWRRRKQKLDAAAAAIILQDFLDRTRPEEDLSR
jgi:putative holliday junction resolvase